MPRGVYVRTEEHRKIISSCQVGLRLNENHPLWKGEKVSYSGVHKWVYRHKGKATVCELQDETCSSKYEWSNISGSYKRDFNDWQQLCASHHRRTDGNGLKQKRVGGRYA